MSGNSWIMVGIITAAIAAFAIPYGFYLKSKEQPNASVHIAGDYISGPKVGGDYVAGDKITNIGSTPEELENIVRRVMNESSSRLSKSFGDQYTVFGISDFGLVVPKGIVPSGLNVRWETGSVIKITDETFKAVLPEIVANTKHIRNFSFGGNTITLPKKVGARRNLIKMKDFSVIVEVIGVDKHLVVVGLGLAPEE